MAIYLNSFTTVGMRHTVRVIQFKEAIIISFNLHEYPRFGLRSAFLENPQYEFSGTVVSSYFF